MVSFNSIFYEWKPSRVSKIIVFGPSSWQNGCVVYYRDGDILVKFHTQVLASFPECTLHDNCRCTMQSARRLTASNWSFNLQVSEERQTGQACSNKGLIRDFHHNSNTYRDTVHGLLLLD